jgi:hypothetical protein
MEISFEKQLIVGDIVTVYRSKGIHIVTKIERRFVTENLQQYNTYCNSSSVGDEYASLIYYRQIAKDGGTKVSGKKEFICDESYCSVLNDDWFQDKLDKLEHQRRLVIELRQRLNNR